MSRLQTFSPVALILSLAADRRRKEWIQRLLAQRCPARQPLPSSSFQFHRFSLPRFCFAFSHVHSSLAGGEGHVGRGSQRTRTARSSAAPSSASVLGGFAAGLFR